jgi:hypothetical protein
MGWQTPSATATGGSGEMYTASSGTALPADVAVPAAAYVGHGLISEDGVAVSVSAQTQELHVWQQVDAVRRTVTSREILISAALAQFDEQSIPLALGGGSVSTSSPYTYNFPAGDAPLEERAIVVDVKDGSETHRYAFSRINVTEPVETTWNRTSLALLPIGAKVLAPAAGGSPGKYISDATSFAAGS